MEGKRMCRINPRVDFAFKKLFGSEENKDLLIDFINSIVSEKDKVVDLELKNPYSVKNFRSDKISILDIKAQGVDGKWYNIEMQIMDQEYFDKRALYYWSKLYTEQMVSGSNYDLLKKTIGINILNFNCLDEKKYHNCYKILNIESKKEYSEQLELHFIELKKYDEKLSSRLDKWTNFLIKGEGYDNTTLPKELKEVESIQKALEVLETMGLNVEERESYEARLKFMRDEEAAFRTAMKRGIEKGTREGIEKGKIEGKIQGKIEGITEGEKRKQIEIAKKSLEILDDITISKITGLSEEEIKLLRK